MLGYLLARLGHIFPNTASTWQWFALLGVTGVLAGLAISALLKRDKLDRARCKRARNNTAQSRMRWDYRPRDGIQRREQDQAAETADALSVSASGTETDHAVWFDFVAIDPPVSDETKNSLPPKSYD